MDTALKTKWTEALRSGKYQQVRGMLCDGNPKHLCCLGVGAVVASRRFKPSRETYTYTAADLLGLTEHQKDKLVEMNDFGRVSFGQIADYIEKNL